MEEIKWRQRSKLKEVKGKGKGGWGVVKHKYYHMEVTTRKSRNTLSKFLSNEELDTVLRKT